ncbi:glycoside hydrolase N-terminal domain-containing protein [Microbacterium trichothecenolyticum]|uniref:glycosyl hydrolase family 95 catalytic domain-containing protein n=1 Tax=Microbacterium trichothecenolyticum TaxID=69370 RepID=UPI001C6EB775|nr:glycoside hydrolase N-terminal domain-containing protein [Microbacterium trichothecenolyticum]MBW9120132.1 glycoside hydrolase N-terminal domain-containing protein [Microbacterium trichothecenolyticum]
MTPTLQLSWDSPADRWEEATPLGNGRIGAMAFGGASARYALNDATVWSGTPDGPARALRDVIAAGAGPERLAEVRAALAAGDVRTAEELLMSFEGRYSQEFLPLADVAVEIPDAAPLGPARVLDLDDAVLTETLRVPGGTVRRRSWVSAPAGALIVELTSDAEFAASVSLSTPLRTVAADGLMLEVGIPVDGAPLHESSVEPPLRYADDDSDFDAFAAVGVALDTDGFVEVAPTGATVHGARRLLIALSTSSRAEFWWADAGGEWRTASREAIRDRARVRADAAAHRASAELLAEHVADRRRIARARFAIGGRREGTWNVDRDVLHGEDALLKATIAAEYGAYLLSSSSRAGGPAANLQGIWNDRLRPAWSSNYTININTQMNYWAAPVLGLDDPMEPLLALVERVARTGTDTARALYGARGWVAHHNTDLWGWSLPVGMGHGAPSWAIWMMGGVWLTHNLWDAYEIGGDLALLGSRIWPLMRGAVEFCLDWLVPGPQGTLRTTPSTSPENSFIGPDGAPTAIGLTAASDLSLIQGLFERALAAIAALGIDDPLGEEIDRALTALEPLSVDADGRLREWSADVVEVEPLHRHLSPLIGMYPLDTLTREREPSLFDAGVRLLDARGAGAMGWSWAWKIALRARIGDGDAAAALLDEALTPFEGDVTRHGPVDGSEWGGLLPNLFSTHPPFQIDGNLGFPAGIAELLLQSHGGVVRLLPALPSLWRVGDAQGLGARTGLVVDLAWRDGVLTGARLRDTLGADRVVVVEHAGARIDARLPGASSVELTAEDFTDAASLAVGGHHAR